MQEATGARGSQLVSKTWADIYSDSLPKSMDFLREPKGVDPTQLESVNTLLITSTLAERLIEKLNHRAVVGFFLLASGVGKIQSCQAEVLFHFHCTAKAFD